MQTNPALHLPPLDIRPDAAHGAPRGDAMPANKEVGAEVTDAGYPDCSPEFDACEPRAYGGVFASKLAGIADTLVKFRLAHGFGSCVRAFHTLTDKIKHALYIYTRVKDAMAYLYAPEEITLELNKEGQYILPPLPEPRPSFKWDVSPQKAYALDDICVYNGTDMRGTSLRWIERRVRAVKARTRKMARTTYIDAHDLKPSQWRKTPDHAAVAAAKSQPCESKTFEVPAMVTGEIWPPVPIPTDIDTPINVKIVRYPQPSKDVLSVGRKLGIAFYYNWYYADPDNVANMWTGAAGALFREREPP